MADKNQGVGFPQKYNEKPSAQPQQADETKSTSKRSAKKRASTAEASKAKSGYKRRDMRAKK